MFPSVREITEMKGNAYVDGDTIVPIAIVIKRKTLWAQQEMRYPATWKFSARVKGPLIVAVKEAPLAVGQAVAMLYTPFAIPPPSNFIKGEAGDWLQKLLDYTSRAAALAPEGLRKREKWAEVKV